MKGMTLLLVAWTSYRIPAFLWKIPILFYTFCFSQVVLLLFFFNKVMCFFEKLGMEEGRVSY